MLDKHLPLQAAAEIINSLGLDSGQTRRANRTMQRVVRRAWTRRSAAKRAVTLDEFADAVPECHWSLMFEVCGLILLRRDSEACALITVARRLRTAHEQRASDTTH
ncbi:hypothetical protein [Streptomyces sp. NBC_01304]|uniref:hypothetical protein n=1 Tax=Streptomyces sp. NBC_01304 TaxID=2903818 RepID=UPI002E0EC119|nr:hypothetical protein OG430_33020 [Streptomyces sp. NBC_01304]